MQLRTPFLYLPPIVTAFLARAFFNLPVGVHRFMAGEIDTDRGVEFDPQLQGFFKIMQNYNFEDAPDLRERAKQAANIFLASHLTGGVETVSVSIPGPLVIEGRLYSPTNSRPATDAVVVYIHGGGWVVGDIETHDNVCRQLARKAKVKLLAINYRLAPEWPYPAAVQDTIAAVRWAAQNFGRVAIAGDSAGANLALAASHLLCGHLGNAEGKNACPFFQLLLNPLVLGKGDSPSRQRFADGYWLSRSDITWFGEQYCGKQCDSSYVNVALLPDLGRLPPTYVAVSGFDPLRDEGLWLAQRLEEAGVPVTTKLHSSLAHAFANFAPVHRPSAMALDEAADALATAIADLSEKEIKFPFGSPIVHIEEIADASS